LSAVVFRIGFDLIDLKGMHRIFRQRRAEFWVALITLLTVVVVGVEQGIILAIVLSLIEHTRHGYRPKNMLLTPTSSGIWRAQPRATGSQALPGLMVCRFSHSLYDANAQQFSEEIGALVHQVSPPLRWFCLDAAAIDDADFTAAETRPVLHSKLKDKGFARSSPRSWMKCAKSVITACNSSSARMFSTIRAKMSWMNTDSRWGEGHYCKKIRTAIWRERKRRSP
jgi:MFS superfamily sulfate permease-like transporter